jgi:hypothetical protein
MDGFSKAAHFLPLDHLYIAMSVARAFFDTDIKLHGIPHSIISDRDPVFTDHFWHKLFTMACVQAVEGDKQDNRYILALLDRGSLTQLGPVAIVDAVLLQLFLPIMAANLTIQGGVRQRSPGDAPILAR